MEPRWSNDGSKIVFTRREPTGNFAIYVMNRDGTDLQRVTQPISGPYGGDSSSDLFIDTTAVGIDPSQESPLLQNFALEQNYPNPFNSSTLIRYSLPRQAEVSLTIHNILVSEIKQLVDGINSPGVHSIVWDGKDYKGNQVPSGIYLYRLKVGDVPKTRKLILIK